MCSRWGEETMELHELMVCSWAKAGLGEDRPRELARIATAFKSNSK